MLRPCVTMGGEGLSVVDGRGWRGRAWLVSEVVE